VVTGTLFFMLMIAGIVLSKGTVLQGGADAYQGSLAYWIAQLPIYLVAGVFGVQFSVLSKPSNAYLSTTLNQVAPPIQRIVNEVLAPIAENFVILAQIVVVYKLVRNEGGSKTQSFAISVALGAVTFGGLHGARSWQFFVMAFIIMAVMAGALVAEDIGLRRFNYVLVTVGATVGFHRAWNQVAAGGVLSFYQTVLQAQPPVIYVVYPILLFDLLTVSIVVIGTAMHLSRGENPAKAALGI